VPETNIHILVVVVGKRGFRVDQEGLNDIFDDNGEVNRCTLDCRGIASRGWVLEGLGTLVTEVSFTYMRGRSMNLPIAPWIKEVNPIAAHCWPVGVEFQYL